MEKISSNMKKDELYSIFYCPILFHNFILGYICLKNHKSKKISNKIIDYVYKFTKILVWLFVMNNYFKDAKTKAKRISPKIINISETGVLICDPSVRVLETLQVYTDVMLELFIKEKKITISSRVMRRYSSNDFHYYGLRFLDLPQEDFEYFFKFLYGRKYSKKDILWEGGSKPPTLEL